ncbi:MAG TPA: hypothetical protein VN654_21620 [Vicinamibacterales bacterium]|jgi:hypothetical protein|nr:hypothetical protein [Vicinamibacterales bacterium]
MTRDELKNRCGKIEECYEFMLAYAAQGLRAEPGGGGGSQIRTLLTKCDGALDGLGDVLAQIVRTEQLQPVEKYDAFIAVLNRDASDARAAVGLVLAQPSIGSQLVDNLNASIHLRALLTDLFLIDEIVRAETVGSIPLVE